jgi:integrase
VFSLRKRGGVWHARFRVADREGRYERSTRCAKKADAAIVAERWDREASLQSDHVTLERACELYHEKLQRKGAKRLTLERFELSAGHLIGFFGKDRPLDTIRLHDTTAYMDHRRQPRTVDDKRGFKRAMPPAGDRTIAIELGHFQSVLQRCFELELYSRSPKAIWPPELQKGSNKKKRWLTDAEFRAMRVKLQAHQTGGAPQQDWSEHFAVLVYTGMRAGELYLPTADDIDGDQLNVQTVKTSRTGRGYRVIPIHPEIAPILKRRAERARSGAPLFPIDSKSQGDDHKRLKAQERAPLRALHRAAKALGIERVSENDLRRTFASWCRQDGVPETDVLDWMGHTSSRMIREVYAQSSAEHGTRQMQRLRGQTPAPTVPTPGAETAISGQ